MIFERGRRVDAMLREVSVTTWWSEDISNLDVPQIFTNLSTLARHCNGPHFRKGRAAEEARKVGARRSHFGLQLVPL